MEKLKTIVYFIRTFRMNSYLAVLACIIGVSLGAWIDNAIQPVVYVAAEEPAPEPKVVLIEVRYNWTEERINQEIDTQAEKWGVDAELMRYVVWCESRFNKEALGDGGKSRGLVQIHSGYHPDISDEEANDPLFALSFLAEKMSLGQGYLWTCYRNKTSE